MKGASIEAARAAKQPAKEAFEKIGRVVGVGLISVDDGYGVRVNLESAPSEDAPTSIDGVPISIDIVGKISKQGH